MAKTTLDIKELDERWQKRMDELVAKYTDETKKDKNTKPESVVILAKFKAKLQLLQEKLVFVREDIKKCNDPRELNRLKILEWDMETEIEAKKEFIKQFNVRLNLRF